MKKVRFHHWIVLSCEFCMVIDATTTKLKSRRDFMPIVYLHSIYFIHLKLLLQHHSGTPYENEEINIISLALASANVPLFILNFKCIPKVAMNEYIISTFRFFSCIQRTLRLVSVVRNSVCGIFSYVNARFKLEFYSMRCIVL